MIPTIKPFLKQHQAYQKLLDKITEYLFFGGGAGGGKSWLGAEWLMTNCYNYPRTKWFIGRNELSRLMKSSYITFQKVCRHHKIPSLDWKYNGQYNYIQFKNGSRIDLLDLVYKPSDPLYERFGSLEYTGGWIEEAGEVDFGAFDMLKTRIGRFMNREYDLFPAKMLITCNPKKNWLYKIVYIPHREKKLPDNYAFVQSLYQDNPYTAEEYGKQLAQITDEATKQRLKYGNWEYDDDPSTLIEYDAIIDLFTNTLEEQMDRYITCDVARFGQDKTIAYLWRGLVIYKIFKWEKQDLAITTQKLKDLARDERIPYSHIAIDEDGVGGGVVDNMRGVKGFVNNSSALPNPLTNEKENYRNLKSQCYYMLADRINKREIAIEHQCSAIEEKEITEDLEQVKGKDVEKDAPLDIIPKEIIKDLIGRSPDYSDAMMMRMYFFLQKTIERGENIVHRTKTPSTYKKR